MIYRNVLISIATTFLLFCISVKSHSTTAQQQHRISRVDINTPNNNNGLLRGTENVNRSFENNDINIDAQDVHNLGYRSTSIEYARLLKEDDLLTPIFGERQSKTTKEGDNNDTSTEEEVATPQLTTSTQDTPTTTMIILSQPLSFQIIMSIILSLIAISQIILFITFYYNQSKRVLEFAQPIYLCYFIFTSLITTAMCFLYVYISNIGCLIREPVMFISLSCCGSIIAARAWRISTLMSNPLMGSAGSTTRTERGSTERGTNDSNTNNLGMSKHAERVAKLRTSIMISISALSGCDYSALHLRKKRMGSNQGQPLRVKIDWKQMFKAILILTAPQLVLQIIVLCVPVLRYGMVFSTSSIDYGAYSSGGSTDYLSTNTQIGQYNCQSSTSASYAIYFLSILFVLLPFGSAYILNIRPRSEMEKLPQIIDERLKLKLTFMAVLRLLVTNLPIVGMTYYYNAPSIRAYSSIIVVLALPICSNYYIGYVKLGALKSKNGSRGSVLGMSGVYGEGGSGGYGSDSNSVTGRGSAAYAVKMAEMYSKIGRTEETLELIDETLEVWKTPEKQGGVLALGDQRRYKEYIGAGFTQQDLNKLAPEELEMILQLLIIKGDALMKLHGFAAFPLSAELNINAMRIFENCPASKKIKDISIMFPIYNRVSIQLKGGVINQNDSCNLEMDLYSRFYHEAQVQSFHLVRSLGALAEWYGRIGSIDKAFQYFTVMTSIYMPDEHAPLIYKAYSVNRVAVTYAISALWYLQRGQTKQAIQRCDQVIAEILPSYDTKDMIGLYHIFWPLIRVLKWSGEVDKCREFYLKWAPSGIENHFAVGALHLPMCLLLKICDGSTEEYDTVEPADIDMILEFDAPDMTDLNFVTDGWSVKTMAAELCLHLARRLEPGNMARRNLIDRGIQMSTLANERSTTEDGLIKHIMAYEAHKGIDDRLIALRNEDNAVSPDIIYDKIQGLKNQKLQRRDSLGDKDLRPMLGKNHVSFGGGDDNGFASKFVVSNGSKESRSYSNSSSGVTGSGILKSSSHSRGGSNHSSGSTGSTTRPFSRPFSSGVSKSSHHSQHSRRASDCDSIAEEVELKQ